MPGPFRVQNRRYTRGHLADAATLPFSHAEESFWAGALRDQVTPYQMESGVEKLVILRANTEGVSVRGMEHKSTIYIELPPIFNKGGDFIKLGALRRILDTEPDRFTVFLFYNEETGSFLKYIGVASSSEYNPRMDIYKIVRAKKGGDETVELAIFS
jgi:hypothetical protein